MNTSTCPCGTEKSGPGCFCDSCSAKLAGVGRILLALIFVVGGINMLLGFSNQAEFLGSKEYVIPVFAMLPGILMAAVGLALKLGAGLALLLGFKASRAAGLLVIYVILATLMFHVGEGELTNALKNLAVIGGLLFVMAHGGGAWGMCGKQTPTPVASNR